MVEMLCISLNLGRGMRVYRLAKGDIKSIAWGHFAPIGDGYDIIHIHVHSDNRRKGIAKKMISDFIRKVKPKAIMLEVRKSNVTAINLYKSLGFIIISKRKGYYKNGEDAWVMRKTLKNEE